MNCISRLFVDIDESFLLLTKKDQANLVRCTVLYLFRGCTASEHATLIKRTLHWKGQQCINFRAALAGKGYIQLNLKFFTYAHLVAKFKGSELVKSSDFEIEDKKDILMCRSLAIGTDEYSKRLRKLMRSWLRKGYKPRTMQSYQKGINRVSVDLRVYCLKYAWSSMSFLMGTSSQAAEDLAQDMLGHGTYAIYRAYPQVESFLQMTNIAKTAIHNRGQNIIQQATTQSRKGLINDGQGFHAVAVSLSSSNSNMGDKTNLTFGERPDQQLTTCNALMVGRDGRSADKESPDNVDRIMDLRSTLLTLHEQTKDAQLRQFMTLMLGEPDMSFSCFLGVPNDQLFDTDRVEYLRKTREYLAIPKPRAQRFLRHLRRELSVYC